MTLDLLTTIGCELRKEFESEIAENGISLVKVIDGEQDIKVPAFFIEEITSRYEQVATLNRKQSESFISIRYYPKDVEDKVKCYEVGERLKFLLEMIDFKGCKIRGTSIYYEVKDCVLHFFITYQLHFYVKEHEEVTMKNLEIEEGVK